MGPRGRRRGRRERGDVRAAILLLLAEQPRHGYEIITEIADRSDGAWQPSPGSVYPTLKRLAREGLVGPDKDDSGKRVFSLTDAGREVVEAEREAWGTLGAGGSRRRVRQHRAHGPCGRRPNSWPLRCGRSRSSTSRRT